MDLQYRHSFEGARLIAAGHRRAMSPTAEFMPYSVWDGKIRSFTPGKCEKRLLAVSGLVSTTNAEYLVAMAAIFRLDTEMLLRYLSNRAEALSKMALYSSVGRRVQLGRRCCTGGVS